MEIAQIEKDIKVFYITASTFPDGIKDAIDKLHSLLPFTHKRRFFGLSRPEGGGEIIYRAAAEELEDGEAKRLGCETLIIPKGNYVSLTVNNFRDDPMSISKAFEVLLAEPALDQQGYCVECYFSENESVKCMIKLDDNKV